MQCRTIVGPANIIGASFADPCNGQRAGLFAYGNRLPTWQQRHGEDFVVLAEGDIVAAWAYFEVVREFALRMNAPRFAIQSEDDLEDE